MNLGVDPALITGIRGFLGGEGRLPLTALEPGTKPAWDSAFRLQEIAQARDIGAARAGAELRQMESAAVQRQSAGLQLSDSELETALRTDAGASTGAEAPKPANGGWRSRPLDGAQVDRTIEAFRKNPQRRKA